MDNIFETLYQHYENSLKEVAYVDYRETSLTMGGTGDQIEQQTRQSEKK